MINMMIATIMVIMKITMIHEGDKKQRLFQRWEDVALVRWSHLGALGRFTIG